MCRSHNSRKSAWWFILELELSEDDETDTQIWCVADFKLEKTGIIRLLEVVKKNTSCADQKLEAHPLRIKAFSSFLFISTAVAYSNTRSCQLNVPFPPLQL